MYLYNASLMKLACSLLFACLLQSAVGAEIFSSQQIQERGDQMLEKAGPFASADLGKYKGHYTMLAVRNQTGSAEIHEHEADYFVVEKGGGTLITGGKVLNPHTEKPGEIRGTSIEGGDRHKVAKGDVVHIPAGEPHQLLIEKGNPISYFVVKVTGQ